MFQVQPDMEELTENAEEPDEGESKHSEQKLGKLQYKVFIGNHFIIIVCDVFPSKVIAVIGLIVIYLLEEFLLDLLVESSTKYILY